jgi:hypothetical protein
MSAADLAATYHCPPAEDLIFDHHTAVLAEELSAFLAGWLGLAAADYTPADLQTAAAVMVDHLGLRHGALRMAQRVIAHMLETGS